MNSKTAPTQAGPLDLIVRRDTLTHKNAVKRMVLWLRNSRGCAVVMAERSSTYVIEKPDVIGWKSNSASILIECKVSRSDFLADKLKSFRRMEEMGLGDFRYFAAPKGMLTPEDMPEGWGLLEIGEHQVRERLPAQPKTANKTAEVSMLVSCIRRLEISATVFVRHDDDETPNGLMSRPDTKD